MTAPSPTIARSDLKLTIIVVTHNMERELPRTLLSLSTSMQQGISDQDYEVIVVDNGSTEPFIPNNHKHLIPGLRSHSIESATHSPVPAVNAGLKLARGQTIGVFIDGARLVSPGMLNKALMAMKLAPDVVVGTLGFHLGPDVQMHSIKEGYDQHEEDKLLAESEWTTDGYRLFTISQFAGASRRGWFSIPNETNGLFLKRERWEELGGYDVRFKSPGGGLANHDMWRRACTQSDPLVVMLLGEATFHQVHGGIATNAAVPHREIFHAEYNSIHGQAYKTPDVSPVHFGAPHPFNKSSLENSLKFIHPVLPKEMKCSRQ